MATTGDVLQAIFFGSSVVTIDGELSPDVTLRETLIDTTTITDHPLETGASVSDHAYNNPAEVTLEMGFANKGLAQFLFGAKSPAEAYDYLQTLNTDRQPFDLLTTRRAYTNMLIKSMSATTDQHTNQVLMITVNFRQVFLVSTSNVQLSPATQADPAKTGGVNNTGTKQTTALPDSALKILSGVLN